MTAEFDHPVWTPPTVEQAQAHAALQATKGRVLAVRDAWLELEEMRRKRIVKAKENPLAYGWEPSIWRVADALLGFDWAIPTAFGSDYGKKMRLRLLGRDEPMRVLMIFGGGRAGKTHYGCKRLLQSLMHFDASRSWCFHQTMAQSVEYHHKLIHGLMPESWRQKPIKSQTTYISFSEQNGFTGEKFHIPNKSNCEFRCYQQDRMTIEGGLLGDSQRGAAVGFFADEEAPEDWVDTMIQRLGERKARGIFGFTPVNGYTGVAKKFLQGAVVKWHSTGWLFSKREINKPNLPKAFEREDCDNWSNQEGPILHPDYDAIPRFMQCADRTRGVLYFHTSDNAFSNSPEQWNIMQDKPGWYQRERFYGIANGQRAGQFPLFSDKVHVCPDDAVPEQGTFYHYVDPCEGRNFFMTWAKACPNDRHYVTHEWPSRVDPIPGHGLLGEWAVPSGGKLFDGKAGPAQDNLGWGLIQYKKEIARIEGWECYSDEADDDEVRKWDQHCKKRIPVYMRFMDARYGNSAQLSEDGARTLFEEFDDIGLTFCETSGLQQRAVDEGVKLINAALYYNNDRPVVIGFNEPHLYFCASCQNTIFSVQTWTGQDKGKGATKDPIDNLRWHFLKQSVHIEETPSSSVAGAGCY